MLSVDLLHNPEYRNYVCDFFLNHKAQPKERDRYLSLFKTPPVVPTPEQIDKGEDGVKWASITLNRRDEEVFTFAWFEGIGRMVLYSTPHEGFTWLEAIPGDGYDERNQFLEKAWLKACPHSVPGDN